MVWINVEINLEVDRWVMGWVYMSLGWSGWVEESTHVICALSLLLCCPACKKLEMKILSKDAKEI